MHFVLCSYFRAGPCVLYVLFINYIQTTTCTCVVYSHRKGFQILTSMYFYFAGSQIQKFPPTFLQIVDCSHTYFNYYIKHLTFKEKYKCTNKKLKLFLIEG